MRRAPIVRLRNVVQATWSSRAYLKAKSGRRSLAERRKGDLVVKCQLMAKSGDPWLAERFRENLVVKCQLMAKSGNPWLAERRKGDLVVKGSFEGKERQSLACGTS